MSGVTGKKAKINYYLYAIKNEKKILNKLESLIRFCVSFLLYGLNQKNLRDMIILFRIFIHRLLPSFKMTPINYECKDLPGKTGSVKGNSKIATKDNEKGYLLFGPYVSLPKGEYHLSFTYSNDDSKSSDWDIYFNDQKLTLKQGILETGNHKTLEIDFHISQNLAYSKMEFRVFYNQIGTIKAHKLKIKGKQTHPKTDKISWKNYIKPPSIIHRITPDPYMELKDIKRLQSLHNRFKGNRIFIIGNGPSLNKTPLHLLKNEYTFGVNRIYLLFDRIDWRPTFYTAFDVRVVPDIADEIKELDIEYKFFATKHKQLLGESSKNYWHIVKPFYEGFDHCFNKDVVYSGFGGGGTIGTIAIELAFYMGFDPIYLIGTDVNYQVKETVKQSGPDKFKDGIKLNLESTEDDDPNHFDPRYFGKGKKWHNPNVKAMIKGFESCRISIENRGRCIYNATVGGQLEVMERVDIRSLF